jgi:heme/copper-type cytochrome/quinol oxidase subunit 3
MLCYAIYYTPMLYEDKYNSIRSGVGCQVVLGIVFGIIYMYKYNECMHGYAGMVAKKSK